MRLSATAWSMHSYYHHARNNRFSSKVSMVCFSSILAEAVAAQAKCKVRQLLLVCICIDSGQVRYCLNSRSSSCW
eukprot:844-Heterococcus_DN1.PRE.5